MERKAMVKKLSMMFDVGRDRGIERKTHTQTEL